MFFTLLKLKLAQFRDDVRGSIMVETVITLPLLFWTMAATYEFFEVHRYKSIREKATYTIADMISREQDVVNATYIDNAMVLFNEISNDDGVNQIRVSIVQYNEGDDKYEISWSEVRGTGSLNALTNADVANAHSTLPIMADGEQVIVVESVSNYDPLFNVGLGSGVPMDTRVFTSIRFAPQICFDACTS